MVRYLSVNIYKLTAWPFWHSFIIKTDYSIPKSWSGTEILLHGILKLNGMHHAAWRTNTIYIDRPGHMCPNRIERVKIIILCNIRIV